MKNPSVNVFYAWLAGSKIRMNNSIKLFSFNYIYIYLKALSACFSFIPQVKLMKVTFRGTIMLLCNPYQVPHIRMYQG